MYLVRGFSIAADIIIESVDSISRDGSDATMYIDVIHYKNVNNSFHKDFYTYVYV